MSYKFMNDLGYCSEINKCRIVLDSMLNDEINFSDGNLIFSEICEDNSRLCEYSLRRKQ